jgi:hypothetical protein
MAFPIPLTAFEEYMVLDGTPAHPMEFFFRLRFAGGLDITALRAAFEEALARHPLLQARIDRRPGRHPRFVAADDTRPAFIAVVRPHAAGPDDYPALPPLDHARGPLVRLTVVTPEDAAAGGPADDAWADLIAQFHHAGCDGLGALDFLEDLVGIAAAKTDARPARLDRLEPARLARRGRYGFDAWSLLASLPRQARGLEGVWQYLANDPVRLPRGGAAAEPHRLASCSVACDAATTAALRREATRLGVSLNDLAAAALFESLRESLGETDFGSGPAAVGRRDRRVVRLSIPMNLRQAADRRMPAANIVSMVFLDRGAAAIDDPAGLLRSIHDEMQLIRRLGLGMTFLFTLWAARLMPGGIARLVRNQQTAATALFTNIGRLFRRAGRAGGGCVRIGTATLRSIDSLAPLRQGTPLAVTAAEYAQSWVFTLRYDPAAVSADQVHCIAGAFRSRLHRHGRRDEPAARRAELAEAAS